MTGARHGSPSPLDLEADLAPVLVEGQPIGSTLGPHLMRLDGGGAPHPLRDLGRLASRPLTLLRRPSPVAGPAPRGPARPGVCLWSADTERINRLLLPVVSELARRGAPPIVLGRPGSRPGVLPPAVRLVASPAPGSLARARWAGQVGRGVRPLVGAVRRARRRGVLERGAVPGVLALLLDQSMRLVRAHDLLARLRPAFVLSDYDRSTFASPYVLAARALGIPTVTLVHGPVGDVGYTPLLADRALCWGERQAASLRRAGADPSSLEVVGCPGVPASSPADRAEVAARVGVPLDRAVVTLGTNRAGSLAARRRLAETFCRALDGLPGVQGLVRCHPTERLADYEPLLRRYTDVRWQEASDLTLDECLALSTAVVYRATGFGNDAVLRGLPAVLTDLPGDAPTWENEVAMGPDGPVARSVEELRDVLASCTSPSGAGRWAALIEESAAAICAARGDEAVRRTVAAVLARAHGGERPTAGSLGDDPGGAP